MKLEVVARLRGPLSEKFGLPRQSGLVPGLPGTVVFEPPFRSPDALRGLEGFSHIWLIWGFSQAGPGRSLTVRPPRLGGNVRMGVFATRSPFRPNPIGLSSVALQAIEHHPTLGPVLHVRGADLADGTPIYDIKPYLPYTDCLSEATGGFARDAPGRLRVEIPPQLLSQVPEDGRDSLVQLLALDPRPAYQHDSQRVYAMAYGGLEVRFTVAGDVLQVVEIEPSGRPDDCGCAGGPGVVE